MTANTSENNKRIAKNTMMLYIRMAITMVVALYTSRVVLQTLGIEDFGIYNVVGGVVMMLGFMSSSMSISIQRFLSYDLGKNDLSSFNRTFCMSILIHGMIALILFLLAETIGLYFLTHHMNFPIERASAAQWIYHFSVLTCCVKVMQVPFNALIISKERMEVFAYLSIVEVFLSLFVVYLLPLGNWDKLKFYSVLLCIVAVLTTLAYILYSLLKIKEIKIGFFWDKNLFHRLIGFASWSALGEIAWAGTGQGVNIVLNLFFGPVVNAARGISYQVQGAINRFSQSFQMALNPQIIKRYAAGDVSGMLRMVYSGTRLFFYLSFLICLPLLLRTQYVLQLWLGEVPPHLLVFCRLIILNVLIDSVGNILTTVAKAHGKIRNYQLLVSTVLFMNLPFSYLILKLGGKPESVYVVYTAISVALVCVRLFLIRSMVGMKIREFMTKVVYPIFIHVILAAPIPLLIHLALPDGFVSGIVVLLASTVSIALTAYSLGLSRMERRKVNTKLYSIIHLKR